MLKVLKFGGSSMADAAQFAKIKAIVESDDSRRVVVVSAPGKRFKDDHKVTDLLYLCHAHVQYGVSCENIFQMIRERYEGIAKDCGLDIDLSADFDKLWRKLCDGVDKDYVASRGEYFAAKLMAAYLGWTFLDAALWLKFNLDGSVDQEATYAALRQAAEGQKVVIPGFYGVMPDGRVATFTRGGSDITGALAAAALHFAVHKLEIFAKFLGKSSDPWLLAVFIVLPLLGLVLSFFSQRLLGGMRYAKSLSPLILALHRRKTRIPFRETFSHLISSALSVGCGGSAAP